MTTTLPPLRPSAYEVSGRTLTDYVFDYDRFQIFFEQFRVPFRMGRIAETMLPATPAHAFLCRSPEFTPAKADILYDHIAARCTVTCL